MRRMLFLTILLTFCHVRLVIAEGPALINYQGTLKDAQGQPIASDTRKLTFKIYDTASGGNLIWGPQIFNQVPIVNGQFNVILGMTDTDGDLISDSFSEENRFLSITVGDGTEITPRQQFLSTPYSFNANFAKNAESSESLGENVITYQNDKVISDRTIYINSGGIQFADGSVQSSATQISCTTVYSEGPSVTTGGSTAISYLPGGYTVLAGGCSDLSNNRPILDNHPLGTNGWRCMTNDHGFAASGTAQAWAIGCDLTPHQ